MSDSQPPSATSDEVLSDAGEDTGSPNTTPETPDDISRWQSHIDLQNFGEGLQAAARASFPNTNKSRYRKVSVLMLSWEDEDPNLPVSIEIERLRNAFERLYRFETEIWKIPDQNCHAKLNRKILDFVTTDDDNAEELFIVYYAGHAKLTRDRLLAWTSWRNNQKAKCPLVQWSGIQNVLEQAESDVLILLDCCHAGTANASEGNKVTELISACAYNARANGVGYYSFTKELIIELEELSLKPSFTIAELHRNIFCRIQGRRPEDGRERHPAPIHISLTQDSPQFPRSIQLSVQPDVEGNMATDKQDDLSDPEAAPSVSSLLTKVPRILLAVRLKEDFQIGELLPDLFKEWLRSIPTVAEEVRVEAGFGSFSTIVLVSIPFSLCTYLPNDPAIVKLGPITTANLVLPMSSAERGLLNEDIRALNRREVYLEHEIVDGSKTEVVSNLNWLTSLCLHTGRVFLSLKGITMEGWVSSDLWSFAISMGPVIIFDIALPVYHGGKEFMLWVRDVQEFLATEVALLRVKETLFPLPKSTSIPSRKTVRLYLSALATVTILFLAIQIPKSSYRAIWNRMSTLPGKNLDSLGENIFGVVALVVSLVALITTVIQVLEQLYSSADGYRRSSESVMGLWSKATRRRIRLSEFRVEVLFETPVLFLASPNNASGPIRDRPIKYIDGTEQSYQETLVQDPAIEETKDMEATARAHHADDEKASWVTLLSMLQREERESRAWDAERLGGRNSKHWSLNPPQYQLAVGLQKKVRSWDFMPMSVNKPYATTTISHLVEMMAMLSVHWKVFDEKHWNLRAEGNGFILTSTTVHGLGVMAVFSVTGRSKFQETRVIPTQYLRELCFGDVTTIFREDETGTSLQFGNSELYETLEVLGVRSENLKNYEANHRHLFSVAFEIIGMLSKVFRLRGSNFKRIPNPTMDSWSNSFSKIKLIEVYINKLKEVYENHVISNSLRVDTILSQWDSTLQRLRNIETDIDIDLREDIHDAIDSSTAYLQSQLSTAVIAVVAFHLNAVLSSLGDLSPQLNAADTKKEEILMDFYFGIFLDIVRGKKSAGALNANNNLDDERHSIWITLVFRMLCWLLLHDFSEEDVQIVPSDLKGSRMPVYIG